MLHNTISLQVHVELGDFLPLVLHHPLHEIEGGEGAAFRLVIQA